MMHREDIADVLQGKEQTEEWLDPSVPSHRKRLPRQSIEETTFYQKALMDEAIGLKNPH